MPLHGKIVVIKRSGGDGTEYPLTATCLFGRKPDCDIRIQLPHVSKEHCRIDLNENKEVVLTNLSSVNPTCVNGVVLQQSERLKHGDVITIIDRSFRFEYPPGRTPKKTPSKGVKPETLKVLRDQQVGEKGEKRISEVSTDPHLKDGTSQENIQQPLEKTVELESKGDSSLQQSKTDSPFNDLYQMIKQSLDVKTPRKSSVSLLQTPSSRFCTPKPVSERRSKAQPPAVCEENRSAKKEEEEVFTGAECKRSGTPQSGKKQRRSSQLPPAEAVAEPTVEEAKTATESKVTSPRRRTSTTPKKFSVPEVIEQVVAQTPKSPVRRRSKEGTPAKSASPKKPGKSQEKSVSKKRKSGELGTDVATQQMKRKRVSFGGHLSPELFDKRLPPDSPLRRGATPRRSLSLLKPKNSLLRRASVIGMLKEFDQDSPKGKSPAKAKTPSPKKSSASKTASPKTPTPTKKVSKSSSPSPKPASAAKKSPKSASSSPKATTPAKKSPKSASSSPKGATPAKKSPKSKSPSPKGESLTAKSPKPKSPSPAGKRSPVATTPAKTPKNSGIPTPTTQGRFSVSRISTPSPTAQVDAVAEQGASVTATPKISLKRKSMKSTTKKTPSISKSAIRVIQRRSGISRASMKVSNCWADIVKFGKPKAQVSAPSQAKPSQKMTKKVVSKPQLKTPARKPKGHVSTGHADSPATIVVGKAHKRTVTHPTGAAPRVITNIVLLKKNMKMDEDLSGISTMFKTPVNERKRRSVRDAEAKAETAAGTPVMSVVDPSVLNTPEEPGEMMVSPLSVASAIKGRSYNSEAVQRLLDGDEESSFVSDMPALETESDAAEQQCTDSNAASVSTPRLKPQTPECLTRVKRLMQTPREKAERVEDLGGKLLKTPKQRPEQQECLTGVKRLMKTPREKAEPLEDLRGKLLKTPKQKPEQEECLSGVKRLMKTPRVKAEPVEDLRGKLLKTPKQKPEQQECLSAVKMLMKTPDQKAEPTEDITGKLLTPAAQKPEEQECLSEAKSDFETPQQEAELPKTPKAQEAADVVNMEELVETPAAMEVAQDLSEVMAVKPPNKRIMKTPKEKAPPVEDMVGLKRLMKTPKERGEPVEDKFGLKRLMKSPRLRGNAPVEDFEGLAELMEEPMPEPEEQLETNEDGDQMPVESCEVVAKEPHSPQQDEPSETVDVATYNLEAPSTASIEPSDVKETLTYAAADENVQLEAPKVDKVEESLIPEVEFAPGNSTEVDTAATEPGQKKTTRGRRAKVVEAKEEPEAEEPVVPAPARGRRGKKTEAAAPPAARQTTRGRNAKATESTEAELTAEENAPEPPKPKRGRAARKAADVPVETVQEIVADTEKESETEQSPVDVDDGAAPLKKVAAKPKRAGRAKRPEDLVPVQEEVPQADVVQETDVTSASSAEQEVKPSDGLEAEQQPLETESLAAAVQKKPVRGRRGKQVNPKETEERQEEPEEPAVSAPVRGRRGRKAEAAAPPAVRQRGRSAKSAESAPDQPAAETQPEAEVPTEAASLQTFQKDASQEENVPSEEEAVPKLPRGRRARQTPAEAAQPESEQSESASDEQVLTEAQPEQPTAAKPRRGRKTKADATEQREATEETAVTVETIQQAQPPVRAKRGRNAKLDEVKMSNVAETTESQEPAKKIRKTRKLVEEQVEATEEVQSAEMDHPEKADASLAEPKTVAAKPKRGRKAEQEPESGSTEVTAAISDKPKRGRRGKQIAEESEVPTETPEEKPEAEEVHHEPAAEAVKPSKTRGSKREVPQVVPAKRARRGAAVAVEEGSIESIAPASEPASVPAEPVRRGRRAAAKPTTDEATVVQKNPPEDPSSAVGEDAKLSKKSVQWKSDVQIFEISNPTPVKAVRGKKSKSAGKADTKSKIPPTEAGRTEEEDLSGKTAEAQPIKRARRGAKAADKAEATSKPKDAEAEAQPKTRRGRPAKK